MVYNFLPFMILPIYTTLIKLDKSYIEAAADLGANPTKTFLKVVLPLSMSGILAGVTMVFIPSTTTFAISQLLGGGKTMLYGDLIYMKFITEQSWSTGSALSIILLVFVLLSMTLMKKAERKTSDEGGGRYGSPPEEVLFRHVLGLVSCFSTRRFDSIVFCLTKQTLGNGRGHLRLVRAALLHAGDYGRAVVTLTVAAISSIVATVLGTLGNRIHAMKRRDRLLWKTFRSCQGQPRPCNGISLMLLFLFVGLRNGTRGC
jgi:ABC-type spermidine/putrescine transport system permease subunit II